MIERHLSDHAHTYVARAEQRLAVIEATLESAAAARQDAIDSLAAARRSKSWWKRLFVIETDDERLAEQLVVKHQGTIEQAQPKLDESRVQLAKATKGADGEQVLPAFLARTLSDRWTLNNGCFNNKGEIDHLLAGPNGIWAIEVKTNKVQLEVYGDDWRWHRVDKRGNRFKSGAAANGSGRTWGRQVAEPARALAKQLRRRGQDVEVRTAVVLVDPLAKVKDAVRPGVDLVTADLDELKRAIIGGKPVLDDQQLFAIDKLIVEHHQYHEKRQDRSVR